VSESGVVATSTNSALLPGTEVIRIDPRYFRPAEVDLLIGDATKAKINLGWAPRHTLSELVSEMVTSDIALFRREVYLQEGGFGIKSRFE